MSIDWKAALADILNFVEQAGALAVAKQASAAHEFKPDATIVTEVDLAVTEMAKQAFKRWTDLPNHTMVDEESISDIGTPEEVFANSEYQWVIDPIDGTAAFAAGLPSWGILVAVLKQGEPILGVTYLPDMAELFIGTPEGTEVRKWPFTSQEVAKPADPRAPVFGHEAFSNISSSRMGSVVGHCWSTHACHYYSSAVLIPFTAVYRLRVSVVYGAFWDVAAGFKIAKNMGVEYYLADTGEKMTRLTPDMLKKDGNRWALRTNLLVMHPSVADEVWKEFNENKKIAEDIKQNYLKEGA